MKQELNHILVLPQGCFQLRSGVLGYEGGESRWSINVQTHNQKI